MSNLIVKVSLSVFSALATLFLAEICFHAFHRSPPPSKPFGSPPGYVAVTVKEKETQAIVEATIADPEVGVAYRPGFAFACGGEGCLGPRVWSINRHGHISNEDYPEAKRAGEYRILVLGDSFAAGVTNSVRWPDAMQTALRNVRVINMATAGTGPVQWAVQLEKRGLRFQPDLVCVSLIIEDVRRTWMSKAPTPQKADSPPWHNLLKWGKEDTESLNAGFAALQKIQSLHANVVYLHHPQYEEYSGAKGAFDPGTKKRLYEELPIVDMKSKMPVKGWQQWYQVPLDNHPSDEGMRVYGKAVAEVLLSKVK